MIIRIGLENNTEGRSQAWALDFPGVLAYGADGSEALLAVPRGLVQYEQWVNHHAGQDWLQLGDFDLRLVETFTAYTINRDFEEAAEGEEINAWFRDDWRPLGENEIQRGLDLLGWARADLLAITAELPAQKLDAAYPGERWSMRGILEHISGAEGWYLDRLGLAPRGDELPQDTFERLAVVRRRLREVLPGFAGVRQALGVDGEFWSPRKLLRRAIWHEQDHIAHIIKLL